MLLFGLWLRRCRFLPHPKVTHFCCWCRSVGQRFPSCSSRSLCLSTIPAHSGIFTCWLCIRPSTCSLPLTARAQEWSKKLTACRGNLSLLLPVVFLHLLCKRKNEVRLEMERANPSCQHCCEHISFRASIPAPLQLLFPGCSTPGSGDKHLVLGWAAMLGSQLAIN